MPPRRVAAAANCAAASHKKILERQDYYGAPDYNGSRRRSQLNFSPGCTFFSCKCRLAVRRVENYVDRGLSFMSLLRDNQHHARPNRGRVSIGLLNGFNARLVIIGDRVGRASCRERVWMSGV